MMDFAPGGLRLNQMCSVAILRENPFRPFFVLFCLVWFVFVLFCFFVFIFLFFFFVLTHLSGLWVEIF